MRDVRARIYDNNQLLTEGIDITAPDDGSFPIDNALDAKRRNQVWRPGTKSFTVEIDLGYDGNVSLFSMMGPANGAFGLSDAASVTLKGNMINVFDGSEAYNQSVDIYDNGIFQYLDSDSSPEGLQFRYWQIVVDDTSNPDDLFINYLFLGDALRFNYNIERGFTVEVSDQTIQSTSDSGVIYSSQRPQFRRIRNLSHKFINNEVKNNILTTIQEVGLHTPFIFALDPTEKCFGPDFSHYISYFNTLPKFIQVRVNDFNVDYDVREVL